MIPSLPQSPNSPREDRPIDRPTERPTDRRSPHEATNTSTTHHREEQARECDVHDAQLRGHVQGPEGVRFPLVGRLESCRYQHYAARCQDQGEELAQVVYPIAGGGGRDPERGQADNRACGTT